MLVRQSSRVNCQIALPRTGADIADCIEIVPCKERLDGKPGHMGEGRRAFPDLHIESDRLSHFHFATFVLHHFLAALYYLLLSHLKLHFPPVLDGDRATGLRNALSILYHGCDRPWQGYCRLRECLPYNVTTYS